MTLRVVSLVPSLTETVTLLGAGDLLAGVTSWCVHGAPDDACRVGGTKNPDLEAVAGLAPDVVLANTEENRAADLATLRERGMEVLETYPRTVADVVPMLRAVAARLGVAGAEAAVVADLTDAIAEARDRRPPTPIVVLTLVWRRPWMGVGRGTYVDDLLATCGFANVLAGFEDAYPRLDRALVLAPEVVLLPSEPYAFGEDDLPAVRDWLGDVPVRFVDGEELTWHGHRTAGAVRSFTALARGLREDADQ